MQASLSALIGALVAVAVIYFTRRDSEEEPPEQTTIIAWIALGTGVMAALAFGASALQLFDAVLASIGLAVLAGTTAVAAYVRGDRTWPVWVGLATGGTVAAFWIVFLVASIVSPQ